MKKFSQKWRLAAWLGLVLWGLCSVFQVTALAQGGSIKNLTVELWPEYDRAETLVLYRVELAPGTALPAEVTFRLPGYLEKMHVVAVEREGALVEVSPETITLQPEGDNLLLTFSTPVPKIQFEYYDPTILTKQGQERQLKFDLTASYPIEKASLQVQEPFEAEKFSMTPAPGSNFTGSDGLQYHIIEIAGLVLDETVTLTASYSRASDEVSVQSLGGLNAEHAADLSAPLEPVSTQNLTLGYSLIGIGVALLLGVGGYWWWSKQKRPARAVLAPRQAQKRTRSVKMTAQAEMSASGGAFCYRCGAALREEANFCHGCGAERRR